MKKICIVGALDTKGPEYQYLKNVINREGFDTIVINIGILGEPYFEPDYSAYDVAKAAGEDLNKLIEKKDPSFGVSTMGNGARKIVKSLYANGYIAGCISIGGGQGSFMGCTAMADLPIGFPKLLASTVAFKTHDKNMRDIKDGFVCDTVVDVCGLNSILKQIITNAAGAVCGMARVYKPISRSEKKRIGITMLGVTTLCVERVVKALENDFEIQVYHSTGIGGAYMEQLIYQGEIDGVIDLTAAEISQRVSHGTCAGIPKRMEGAGYMGIPQVVSFGGTDLVNCSEELLCKVSGDPNRLFHKHNPTLTLMRANKEEMCETARIMAKKLNKSKAPVTVVIPLKGVSAYDKEGMFFYDPDADSAMFETFKMEAGQNIKILELNCHINDQEFTDTVAELMKENF